MFHERGRKTRNLWPKRCHTPVQCWSKVILENHRQGVRGAGHYIDLGLQFAVAIGLGVALGYYLDTKWNTTPIMLILGVLLGAAAGFLNIYRAVFPSKRDENDKA